MALSSQKQAAVHHSALIKHFEPLHTIDTSGLLTTFPWRSIVFHHFTHRRRESKEDTSLPQEFRLYKLLVESIRYL